MDFASLLTVFGVPLKVYSKDNLKGHYEGTEWVEGSVKNTPFTAVNEPFIPSSLNSRVPIMLEYDQSGVKEMYDMTWFSSLVVELKTVVEHNGKFYTVEDATPFTDYSNVTQYGCKGVDKFEPEL
ncbi:hypothetical protein LMF32_00880 [Desemzia sp. C1]|uniref:hypothetical protein n=1 Tax=Desemzia sp. C1 TaxID=2892016 RepID=UPI001E53967C|nr:hypothetical protein [Desemzia sp. C1]MCI3027690.1 hypothetical protein [Desemzia sp. C1]